MGKWAGLGGWPGEIAGLAEFSAWRPSSGLGIATPPSPEWGCWDPGTLPPLFSCS